MGKELNVTIVNELSEIERVQTQLEQFGLTHNLDPGFIYKINLAIDELITNTISYGFADDKKHYINIIVTLVEKKLMATIEDDGKYFNPLEVPTPELDQSIEERKIGGLGIYLTRQFTDELSYKRENRKNVISFTKEIIH
ncbi:MAG: ATP-binding protein [Candidatus Marinimicrobia bacterium]|nr:ATP-binding protein [Candidatus Neomarinimicrobiota bacterium]